MGEDMMEYAHSMAKVFNLSAGDVAANGEEIKKLTSKSEINKFLASLNKGAPPQDTKTTVGEVTLTEQEYKEKALKLMSVSIKDTTRDEFYSKLLSERRRLDEKKNGMEERMRQYESRRAEYTSLLRSYKAMEEAYNKGLSSHLPDFATQIQAVTKDGFYTFVGQYSEDNRLVFRTGNVEMHYRDNKLDFGKFLVLINPVSFSVSVIPYQDNIGEEGEGVDSYVHPHIGSGNDVCWGQANASRQSAGEVGDIRTILELVRGILFTYNPDSPYRSFEAFLEREGERWDSDGWMQKVKKIEEYVLTKEITNE